MAEKVQRLNEMLFLIKIFAISGILYCIVTNVVTATKFHSYELNGICN